MTHWPDYRQYGDRAAFDVVYIQEAHPIDLWQVSDNVKDGVLFASSGSRSGFPRFWIGPTIASSTPAPGGRIVST